QESTRALSRKLHGTPATAEASFAWRSASFDPGRVVWARTVWSPLTECKRRTYRSPSGKPPGCRSKATSSDAAERSFAIPRASATEAEPPTTFISSQRVVWDEPIRIVRRLALPITGGELYYMEGTGR